jgi:hypothetical protein
MVESERKEPQSNGDRALREERWHLLTEGDIVVRISPQCLQRKDTTGGPLYTSTTSQAKVGIIRLKVLWLVAKSECFGLYQGFAWMMAL